MGHTKTSTIVYRVWTSQKTFEEVETCHWLADALRKSGIRKPLKVEFKSKRSWLPVCDQGVKTALKAAFPC